MAHRSDELTGVLVYQEGKIIEGELYLVAVFIDPGLGTVSFSAYEIENDSTYTYAFTDDEFQDLFHFDTELSNPANLDARCHWVVERLDFIQDEVDRKMLCVSNEPTPVEEEETKMDQPPEVVQEPSDPVAKGQVDATTRMKLLKELDVLDDSKQKQCLVKNEAARRKFLEAFFDRRQLEQLKASQRLQVEDTGRQERLAKIAAIKKEQKEKAISAKATEDAKKGTMAQLEVLMKQKQAEDIRKLIASKDSSRGGACPQRSAARQKKKEAERVANEQQMLEQHRAERLAVKREEQIKKREEVVKNQDHMLAAQIRDTRDIERLEQVKLREEKDDVIADQWRMKRLEREKRETAKDEFLRLEELGEQANVEMDKRRARDELDNWKEKREEDVARIETERQWRRSKHEEMLLKWKVDASKRAIAKRDQIKRNTNREKKRKEREDEKLRKFREQQFLETLRDQQEKALNATQDSGVAPSFDPAGTQTTMLPEQASYEQQERARRIAENAERQKQEDFKKSKVEKLGATNPNASEIVRIAKWRKEDLEKSRSFEESRSRHDMAAEIEKKKRASADAISEQTYVEKQPLRREASLERARIRNDCVTIRVHNLPIGSALPIAFVF